MHLLFPSHNFWWLRVRELHRLCKDSKAAPLYLQPIMQDNRQIQLSFVYDHCQVFSSLKFRLTKKPRCFIFQASVAYFLNFLYRMFIMLFYTFFIVIVFTSCIFFSSWYSFSVLLWLGCCMSLLLLFFILFSRCLLVYFYVPLYILSPSVASHQYSVSNRQTFNGENHKLF